MIESMLASSMSFGNRLACAGRCASFRRLRVFPLEVDDDARAVRCGDQPSRLPAVERADQRVDILLQERDQRILPTGFKIPARRTWHVSFCCGHT